MLQEDCDGFVAMIFKGAIQDRQCSQQEKDILQQDLSMWREVGKLTATRKEYCSALAKAAFLYSDTNNLHRDIQLAYVPGYDAIRIFDLLLDMVYSTVLHSMIPWAGRPVTMIYVYGDFTSCFRICNISDLSREAFVDKQSIPKRQSKRV